MTDWRKTCDEVIEGRFSEGGKMSDGEHRDVCASAAPRLARVLCLLADELLALFPAHGRKEWIARLWEESNHE